MQFLRKLVLLLAMVYFLFLLLVITNLVSVEFLDRELTNFDPQNFFKVLALIGAALLGLGLAVEQSHGAFMQRRVRQLESSVAQLKSSLYDAQQRAMTDALQAPTPPGPTGPIVPPPSAVPGEMR
jgi:hypothetical protein